MGTMVLSCLSFAGYIGYGHKYTVLHTVKGRSEEDRGTGLCQLSLAPT